MIPIRLKLTNFLSYRETVEVDFSRIHLACISGRNGAGKSTLLDAMTWALFGEARSSNDALIYTGANTAEVELDFEYEGLVYRIQRKKQREKPGTLDLFLQHQPEIGPAQWKPLSEKSITLTQAQIVKILRMNYDTFINASFFLQGRADQFAQKNPTERKKVLSSILGLDIWDIYNKKAAEKRKNLEFERDRVDRQISEIDQEISEEPARKAQLAELETALGQFSLQKKLQEESLNNLRLLDTMLKEQKKHLEIQRSQLVNKQKAFEQSDSLMSARKAEYATMQQLLAREAEINTSYQNWKDLRSALETLDGLAMEYHKLREAKSAPQMTLEKTKNTLEQEQKYLLEKKSAMESLRKDLTLRKKELQNDIAEITEITLQIAHKTNIEAERGVLLETREGLSVENKQLRAEMDLLDSRRKNLQSVQEPSCPFCGQDLTPDHRESLVDEIIASGKKLGDNFRANQSKLKDLEEKLLANEKDLQATVELETRKHVLERKTDVSQAWIDDHEPEINAWEITGNARLVEISGLLETENFDLEERKSLKKLDKEITAINYQAETHTQLQKQEQALRIIEQDYMHLENTRAVIVPLERQIHDLEEQHALIQSELGALEKSVLDSENDYLDKVNNQPDLQEAENEYNRSIENENSLREETFAARQKVLVLDSLRVKRLDLEKERESVSILIGQHKQLERAFGKDGVPALLIEQALPDIENEANDLLERLSSGTMFVRFITQREYKDKSREDKKETLDIQISDTTGVRDYEMFSGGEAFRVNFAIRLALSRVLAQRAGARLQTLVIDEGFGSQDSIGRQRLTEAINLVQGDFSKILVITHLEELKDSFPSRIEVEKTTRGSIVTVVA